MASMFRLKNVTAVDLVGSDAPAILHNLTTNEVKSLAVGCGCETFVTDVRGKTLAHAYAFRTEYGYRLIGAAGQADAIVSHADRYTIREDCQANDRSAEFQAYVISPDAAESVRGETDWGQRGVMVYGVDWLGAGTLLLLAESPQAVEVAIDGLGELIDDEPAFHRARTLAGFPWFGIDLSDKNLPQEAARITQTISFTKGCYLGQETVARLDALGQVQKQLVRWETLGRIPAPGSEVTANEKVVGRLSSVAATSEHAAVAIGMARRSHFDSGSVATGDGFEATVG